MMSRFYIHFQLISVYLFNLLIAPSEKLPQPQQKPDLKQSHPDLLRQQNPDSV